MSTQGGEELFHKEVWSPLTKSFGTCFAIILALSSTQGYTLHNNSLVVTASARSWFHHIIILNSVKQKPKLINHFLKVPQGGSRVQASTVYPKKYALLCFVVVIHWLIFPYPSGLLHWHCGNLTIAPVPAKQPWWIWINTSCEFIMNDCITTTKQSTTKPCAYFLGYTVLCPQTKRHLSFGDLIRLPLYIY